MWHHLRTRLDQCKAVEGGGGGGRGGGGRGGGGVHHALVLTYHSHIIYSPVILTKFPYICILYVDPFI